MPGCECLNSSPKRLRHRACIFPHDCKLTLEVIDLSAAQQGGQMTNNTLLANVSVDLMFQAGLLASRDACVQSFGDEFVKAIARHHHWGREPAS